MQRAIRRYRQGFFDRLRDEVAPDGIELQLFHSNLPPDLDPRPDALEVPWSIHLARRTIRVGSRSLLWQPYHPALRTADLVIVEQAADLPLNYRLLAAQRRGGARVAMWGHGRNFGGDSSRLGEAIKRRTSTAAHWWFAYTDRSATVITELGYPPERVTVVHNAIDTTALAADVAWAHGGPAQALRAELGLGDGAVGIFLGTLRASKRLDLLLVAADRIQEARPDFHLLVVGGGELLPTLQAAATTRPWLHVLGPRFGRERARALAASDVVLIPGAVGLAVLDGLVARTPLITSADGAHGPEIAYLEDGRNGRLVANGSDPSRYAEAVLAVLADDALRARLVAGCREDATRYGIEAMAQRFADGVRHALHAPAR
ncbi:glycosyltransferase family 4 protein [Nitriliruptor alkaliphilus]|uniref:glycosyltransferase family 4 protein n=1 Tax=Nitriliruptor alkaliphilus TaxID=427918 RepID=UPI00069666C2|nr:glycosyltransferase family 4 protein [Nitriliruptor alkaliphilus]